LSYFSVSPSYHTLCSYLLDPTYEYAYLDSHGKMCWYSDAEWTVKRNFDDIECSEKKRNIQNETKAGVDSFIRSFRGSQRQQDKHHPFVFEVERCVSYNLYIISSEICCLRMKYK